MQAAGVPEWANTERSRAESIGAERGRAASAASALRARIAGTGDERLTGVLNNKETRELAGELGEQSGYGTEVEYARILRYATEIVESRKDDDSSNDRDAGSYGDRYSDALGRLLPFLERIAAATEETAKAEITVER